MRYQEKSESRGLISRNYHVREDEGGTDRDPAKQNSLVTGKYMSDILAVSGSPPPPTSYHLGADLPAFLSIYHESETQRVLGVDISGHKDLEYVMGSWRN